MSYQRYTMLHRFGLGPQIGLGTVGNNPKTWLSKQLRQHNHLSLPGKFSSTDALGKKIANFKKTKTENAKKKARKEFKNIYTEEMRARFLYSLNTTTPFAERLVHFWSNHFTVSVLGKQYMSALVGSFEREAIRPHVLGKFSDMLLAVVQHPAMLLYLDNASSIGPHSRAGKKRRKGLNENLAREILELHTLGVNGGYTQQDVIALAKIITGWTITPPRQGGGGFKYIDAIHEPGAHKLLGKSYTQNGQAQGIQALKDLAAHPSTAKFVATKMAMHFVSDNPPKKVIQRLTNIYQRTDGDLKAMAEALIDMPEIWKTPLTKIKTPYEMIVSSLRLLGATGERMDFKKVTGTLQLLDHMPFSAPSPAGWSDEAQDWISPNSTINRVEWCHALAHLADPKIKPLDLAKKNFGSVANPETLTWIERAPSGKEGLALLLASPEWQRR